MLNIVLTTQSVLCAVSGMVLILFPDAIRDFFCDRTVAKCERLSGCGLSASLFAQIGVGLLAWSYLAFITRNFKEPGARAAVVKGMLLTEVGSMILIAKDINSVIFNSSAWIACTVLFVLAALHAFLVSTGDQEHKDLRARAEV
mmetsp:Transcript_7727/g.15544  ORF Transcript_7727/g.15544 Transcript_7727/m.15544 type:complete len:144 (+) Transcript_7727:234-665(+)